jgi:hypothetical protein
MGHSDRFLPGLYPEKQYRPFPVVGIVFQIMPKGIAFSRPEYTNVSIPIQQNATVIQRAGLGKLDSDISGKAAL